MSLRIVLGSWLVVVWVALWGEASAANLLSGLALAIGLVVLFPPHRTRWPGPIRPLAAARFVGYFAWKLVEASAIVAWEVVTPRNRIREGIVAVPVAGGSDLMLTTVANAISLTPGTLTVDLDREPPTLYVHVLHLRDVEAVRRDVRRLEALAARAFGVRAALTTPRCPAGAAPPRHEDREEEASG